jgi:hypothetical protein
MGGFEEKARVLTSVADCGESARVRGPYFPPRVVRVRVETTRMTLGQRDADTFCTVHDHNTGFNACT